MTYSCVADIVRHVPPVTGVRLAVPGYQLKTCEPNSLVRWRLLREPERSEAPRNG